MSQSAALCTVEGLSSWMGTIYVIAQSLLTNDTVMFDAQHYKLRPTGPYGSGAYFHARLNPKPSSSKVSVTTDGRTTLYEIGGHKYSSHYDSGKRYQGHLWSFGSTAYKFIRVSNARTGDTEFYTLDSYTWWHTPGPAPTFYLNQAYVNFRSTGDHPGIDPNKFDQEDYYLDHFEKIMCHPPTNPTVGGIQTEDKYNGRYVNPSEYEMDVINGRSLILPQVGRAQRYWYQLSSYIVITPPQRPCFAYSLNEKNVFDVICDLDVYLAPYASGLETAYLEAAKTLPSVSGNSLANVVELVQGIVTLAGLIRGRPRSIKSTKIKQLSNIQDFKTAKKGFDQSLGGVGEFLKKFKDPRDAWLCGRYSINTTECDIAEYRELISRCVQLDAMCCETIQAFGQFQKGPISYKATMTIRLADLVPKDLSAALRKAGFGMTLSNVWDMIPYSFVVDWFIGVSDVINWAESIGNMLELKPSEIWYSVTTRYNGQEVYFRVPGRFLNNIPALVDNDPSSKTICMRIGDAISLFTK